MPNLIELFFGMFAMLASFGLACLVIGLIVFGVRSLIIKRKRKGGEEDVV